MDDKYQINKSKKPETKQEIIQHQIEELVKRRDKESDLKMKQVINAGFIRRDFDENGQEQCRDGEGGGGQLVPCKEIKVGMKSKTKNSGM